MAQELLFPEFSPDGLDSDALGAWADRCLERLVVEQEGQRVESALVARRLESPLGPLMAAATDRGVAMLSFVDQARLEHEARRVSRDYSLPLRVGSSAALDALGEQLELYFRGELRDFELPVDVRGTDFQRDVWATLRTIPYGTTWSYSEVAQAVGRPSAVRAVGAANGANRVAVVLPCHRVVGSDGTLTGFAAGVWRKRRLLEIERS